jgi:DNA-binding transcriptional regulator YiaG
VRTSVVIDSHPPRSHPSPVFTARELNMIEATKPSRSVIAKAIKAGGGFVAQFALPGLIPDIVRQHRNPVVFATEEKAIAAANQAVVSMLQRRLVDSRKPAETRKITPAEFAILLAEANITPTWFAELFGTTQERVIGWIDGVQDVPHAAYLLVCLMKDQKNLDMIEALTAERRLP